MPDLLFELRCEELPAKTLARAANALRAALEADLAAAGLAAESVAVAYTPRRIALFATGVPAATAAKEERVRGPRAAAAFDAAGAPTKAALGFAQKNGVDATALVRDGDFVYANVKSGGAKAADALGAILAALPAKAGWAKTMRWGAPQPFARPIRGVVALLGADVVACNVNGLAAGRSTAGHRFLAPDAFDLRDADRAAYVEALRKRFVLADPQERAAAVSVAAKTASAEAEIEPGLLDEVTNLVEWPSALLGRFDARFLELPPRLLTTVMAHHQRFFPVRGADGALRNAFVAILDRTADSVPHARPGFERVLVPRLHDAMFFLQEDRKQRLEDRLERLKTVTYHKKLGTLHDKAERLQLLASWLATELGANLQEVGRAGRAGLLAKCDLVTALVGEFPELQGHVGETYAREQGEDAATSRAIGFQYVHDWSGVKSPPGVVPLALVLAENLDIVAKFGSQVGLPTGSADPFGVRRAALTLLDVARRWAPNLDLRAAVDEAGGNADVWAYLDTRLRQRFRDDGTRADFVAAVTEWRTLRDFQGRIAVLDALAADAAFDRILEVAERCRNITKKAEGAAAVTVDPALLTEPAERDLWDAWGALRTTIPADGLLAGEDATRIAGTLAAPLHRFFGEVFVNADDARVRGNRLALLGQIDGTLLRLGDLCKVQRQGA